MSSYFIVDNNSYTYITLNFNDIALLTIVIKSSRMQISKYANMKNQDGDGPVLERITAGQFVGDIEWTLLRAL